MTDDVQWRRDDGAWQQLAEEDIATLRGLTGVSHRTRAEFRLTNSEGAATNRGRPLHSNGQGAKAPRID